MTTEQPTPGTGESSAPSRPTPPAVATPSVATTGVAASRPASIRSVAQLAGVSPGTASKVLNNRGELRPETRAKVLAAAKALNYRPNELVRAVFGRRSFTVGLITTDSFGRFAGPIMAGIEDVFADGGLSVIVCESRGDRRREAEHLERLIGRRVDGAIVTGRCSNPRPPVGTDLPFPVVYAHTPSSDPKDHCVVVDDERAGRIAGRHLREAGRTAVGHITGPWDFEAVRARAAGLREDLALAGLSLAGPILTRDWSEAWGRAAVTELLESHPGVDAVYCGSDLLARGVADGLRELGRRVPDDVAVVGTDNWELIARATRPPLTTVDMNLREVGRAAARTLARATEGTPPPPGRFPVPPRLVVRASTGLAYNEPAVDPTTYHESCIH